MPDINALAVLVAAISVFLLSSIYYTALAKQWATVSDAAARSGGRPGPGKAALELARSLILATVVAGLASRGEIEHLGGGLLLGLALWVGFPFVLWTGAIIWENTPWKLAAIHAGDWLVKLLVIAVIVTTWQ
jgi:Protein of unknown function (DUF1761)